MISRSRKLISAAILAAAFLIIAGLIFAQQPPAGTAGGPPDQGQEGRGGPGGPGQEGRGGGPRGVEATPDDTAGFKAIFDGKTLNGWYGDPMFWRVENGTIVGESTPEKVVSSNTFLIWKGGTMKDFELKIEGRFTSSSGNSGIQVRSRMDTEANSRSGGKERPYGMAGYQVDMVPQGGTGTALIYEEGGRGFLAQQGQITRRLRDAAGDMSAKLVGTLGENIADGIKGAGEWNSYHIIARGNQIIAIVNDRMSAMVIDEDATGRALEGLLGLQMHVGQPFRVEFKNIYFKEL